MCQHPVFDHSATQTATLIRAGAAYESVAETVRKCVGESLDEPPLVNALKLLLFEVDEISFQRSDEPQSSRPCSPLPDGGTLDPSLLLLVAKSVLQAGTRASRMIHAPGGRSGVQSKMAAEVARDGAEAAAALNDPQCAWVSDAATAPAEAGGPARWAM